jgi:5'-3' exonuclease
VAPRSIPDYLALVGDAADGYPGIPGWGARSTAAVLTQYGSIEAIPKDVSGWKVKVRGADRLATTLVEQYDDALLFKRLATLRDDAPVHEDLEGLRFQGATEELKAFCDRLGMPDLVARVPRWRD